MQTTAYYIIINIKNVLKRSKFTLVGKQLDEDILDWLSDYVNSNVIG